MIEALKEAFHEVAQLPDDEQRHIVEMIRKVITLTNLPIEFTPSSSYVIIS